MRGLNFKIHFEYLGFHDMITYTIQCSFENSTHILQELPPQLIKILWIGVDSTLWDEGGLKDHYFKSVVGVGGSSLCSAHINRKFCNRNLHLVITPQGKPIKVQYFLKPNLKSAKPFGDNYYKNKYLFSIYLKWYWCLNG